MENNKNTPGQNLANFLKEFKTEISNKLDRVLKNQQYIKADTTQIGQMLQDFYRQNPQQNNKSNYRGQFVIKNMTDAQAKDLMVRQGVSPQVVAQLSDNKFTVQYLVSLVQK